jgi:coenzyme F420-0:L-glutamate ligase/coenzyme F420-1:gamma-L-glutamate ligase
MPGLRARSIAGLPEIRAGDDLAALVLQALPQDDPRDDQLLAIAQKAVSKSEGAIVRLDDVVPSARALELAARASDEAAHQLARDPRAVQVVLDQTEQLLRAERGILICRTRHGLVCANAGVDASNASEPGTLVVLPRDPDASARRIRARLRELCGRAPAVLISDSFGRPWRHGQLDVAIGLAGMRALEDWRGRTDAAGRELHATWLAVADAAAAAADLVRGKASGEPVAIVDGLERHITAEDGPGAAELIRSREEDLFT